MDDVLIAAGTALLSVLFMLAIIGLALAVERLKCWLAARRGDRRWDAHMARRIAEFVARPED